MKCLIALLCLTLISGALASSEEFCVNKCKNYTQELEKRKCLEECFQYSTELGETEDFY